MIIYIITMVLLISTVQKLNCMIIRTSTYRSYIPLHHEIRCNVALFSSSSSPPSSSSPSIPEVYPGASVGASVGVSSHYRMLDVPREPINFLKDFSVEKFEQKLELEIRNEHPIDSRISFEESKHSYSFDGTAMERSVTGLVESYFEKFDADIAIDKMIRGKRWPRKEYLYEDGKAMDAPAIKRKWDDVGLYARNRGTWMHYNIERALNNLPPSTSIPEMKLFNKFYDKHIKEAGIEPWRTEWRIAAPDIRVGGSVDFVGRNADGTYTIMDWKRSKDLHEKLPPSKWGNYAKYPIDNVHDCDGAKYYLQMNMYRYILQKYYGLTISRMVLVSLHPTNADGTYFEAEAPVMEDEVIKIVEQISATPVAGTIGSMTGGMYDGGYERQVNVNAATIIPPKTKRIDNPF